MIRRWIERVLLTAGIAGIGIWAIANLADMAFEHWQNAAFEHDRQAAGHNGIRRASQSREVSLPAGSLVGRLTVPRLHLRAMVCEGDGDGTLDLSLGHIPGTAFPGQDGNVGVAGHRDTLFRGLQSIEENDLIQFDTLRGSYAYRVVSTSVVGPDDVDVLKPGLYPGLTLVTCYPFHYVGPAPERFIVRARQVVPNHLEE